MQFENIIIHCENAHIVESCEITAAVVPSAGCGSNAETHCWYIMLRSWYINIDILLIYSLPVKRVVYVLIFNHLLC